MNVTFKTIKNSTISATEILLQTNEESQTTGTGSASQHSQDLKSEGVQAGGTLTSSKSSSTSTRPGKEHLQHGKSVDYGDGNDSVRILTYISCRYNIHIY